MFRYLPTQSGYHKRLKKAYPLFCTAILALAAACPSWFDDMWITDATPVHSRWYWGLKLYLVCAGDGMPIMWCLANPKNGEREVLAALLDHNRHLIRDGQILLADKGFAGKQFKHLTEAMGLRLLRPDRKDETYRNGNLGGVRQWIESVNQTLKGQLNPRRPRRTHSHRRVQPHRSTTAGSRGRDLAQLGHQHHQQTLTDRLRPLTPTSRNQPSSGRQEELNHAHRTVRVRIEHALARMKRWKILRDYRRATNL